MIFSFLFNDEKINYLGSIESISSTHNHTQIGQTLIHQSTKDEEEVNDEINVNIAENNSK
jgi:hypothetical protein